MKTKPDLTGKQFKYFFVSGPAGSSRYGKLWRCVCKCGNIRFKSTGQLNAFPNRCCGCDATRIVADAIRKHGLTKTPTHNCWLNIRARCHNKQHPRYADYGGRGIYVCERWRNSFENFLADMGKRPEGNFTIERLDNDGPYSPTNCRWANRDDQANNTRVNVRLTFKGETLTAAQWSKRLGVGVSTLTARIRLGWTAEEAISTPVSRHNKLRNLRR